MLTRPNGVFPDDGGVLDNELVVEAMNAQHAELQHVVGIGHDEHAGDMVEIYTAL